MNPLSLKKTLGRFRAITHRLKLLPANSLILAGLLPTATAFAESTPFSRIIVFGDSLSDTGNFYQFTGRPQWPYADGRFSNGPLWVEYLAEALGMQLLAGDNYAVAGATTGHENYLVTGFPGLQDQIAAFLAASPGGADPQALYVVWAGANDFLVTLERGGDPVELISDGVANTATAVQLLREAGAKYILVPNVPDLGVTPYALRLGSTTSAEITQLSAAYNLALKSTLQMLDQAGMTTIRVDAFGTLQAMAKSPAKFGFTNATEPYLVVYAANPAAGDPARFLFWDEIHPTTSAHQVFGQEALSSLIDYFSPRQYGTAPAACRVLWGERGSR